jgi:hypothetical protein
MSTVERAAVVADHKAKAAEGVAIHRKIAERIKAIHLAKSQYKRYSNMKNLDSYKSSKGTKRKLEYFWDYNTVEAVLLSCSILICLAGVMFESDRFADTPDGAPSRHAWQRDVITYATILLVFVSLIYYATVFLSETGVLQVACLIKLFADKKKAIHRRQEKNLEDGESVGEIQLSSNPMMLKLQESEAAAEANEKLAEMAEAAAKLKKELRQQKIKATIGGGGRKGRKRNNKRVGGKNKFSAKQSDMMDDYKSEIELSEIQLIAKPEGGKKKRVSIKHETGDGLAYYEDESGNTTWDVPGKGVTVILDDQLKKKEAEKERKKKKGKKKGRANKANSSSTDASLAGADGTGMDIYTTSQAIEALPDGWDEHENENGIKYYCRRDTGESTWERPTAFGSGGNYSNPMTR